MNLLSAGGFDRWYGLIIGMAMLICIFAAWFLLKKHGYNADIVFNIAIVCIPCAIVGARLYYIVFDIVGGSATFEYWFCNSDGNFSLMRFIGFDSNGTYQGLSGLAIYGGLIAAALGAIIVRVFNKRDKNLRNHMTYTQMLDFFFMLIILGQAIGRWGNFANEEAYGNAVENPKLQWFPFAVYIQQLGQWRQATFFYESFLNFIGFGIMLWMWLGKRRSYDGFMFSFYCLWYGFIRLFVEGLRDDSLYTTGKFNIFLFVSLIVTGVAICGGHILYEWLATRKKKEKLRLKSLLMYSGAFLFSLFCVIYGSVGLIIGGRLRISQLVSLMLIGWGAFNVIGHGIKAKLSGKRIFLFTDKAKLSPEYCGYENSIIYICDMYEKDGKLKSKATDVPEENFSYSHADDKPQDDNGEKTENNEVDAEK